MSSGFQTHLKIFFVGQLLSADKNWQIFHERFYSPDTGRQLKTIEDAKAGFFNFTTAGGGDAQPTVDSTGI